MSKDQLIIYKDKLEQFLDNAIKGRFGISNDPDARDITNNGPYIRNIQEAVADIDLAIEVAPSQLRATP